MENSTVKSRVKTLMIIHGSLSVVLIVFSMVVLYMNTTGQGGSPDDDFQLFVYVAAGLLAMAFPVSSMLFKNTMKKEIHPDMDLEQKLAVFQSAHLVRMAMFEAPALFSAVTAFLMGSNYPLIILAVVLLVFYMHTPTASNIAVTLELTGEEKEQL